VRVRPSVWNLKIYDYGYGKYEISYFDKASKKWKKIQGEELELFKEWINERF